MFKVEEVYKKQIKTHRERPDGSDYVNFEEVYDTRTVLVNPHYVVSAHTHEFTSSTDIQKLNGCFPDHTKFSTLVLDGNSFRSSEMVIVGSLEKVRHGLADS